MAWQGVEIEIEVPCAGGQKHPVRLRFTGWGEFEVAYNPCEELLGPVFARMAACTHYLHEAFPEAFHDDTDLKRRLVEAFGAAGAPAGPALIQALGDSDRNVRRAAATRARLRANSQGDSHSAVRRAAAEVLVRIGAPAVPALIQALGDSYSSVRAAACEVMGTIGDAQAVPALTKALGDLSFKVQGAARNAIEQIEARQSCRGQQQSAP